jgi:hypothetical protein
MKKSELLNGEIQYATPVMMNLAANDVPQTKTWEWTKRKIDIYNTSCYMSGSCDNGIIRIAIFLTENMRLGCNKPAFEIFIDKENREFITYDYKHNKWRNAKIDMLPWPEYHCYGECFNDENFNEFIKKSLGTKNGGYVGILKWQQDVREEQLETRHKKETAPWDEKMSKVSEEPADWEKWLDKCAISENFIFYEYVKGGAKTGYCTWCEKEVSIKNPKHNHMGRCGRCRREIQFKSIGKAGMINTRRERAYLLQKYGYGCIIRQYLVYKKYPKGNYLKPKICTFEERRVLLDCELNGESYYYGLYKQKTTRWIRSGACLVSDVFFHNYDGTVYKRTLPSLRNVIGRTGLKEMVKQLPKMDPEVYIGTFKQKPYIERIAKAGLTELTYDILYDYKCRDFEIEHVSELGKALRIDKGRLKRLRECNGGRAFLEWLRFEKVRNKHIDNSVISWMTKENIQPKDVEFILDRMSERQIMNYLTQQQRDISQSSRAIISMWDDYLKMALRVKMDVNDEIVYRAKKLKLRHDELVRYIDRNDLAIRAGEIESKFPNVESVCNQIKKKYEYEDEHYAMLVPNSIEDILKEGEMLHHCIDRTDRYFERIHTQESYLLFLRKKDDILQSWYTIEAEPDGTIRQKRTIYDRQNNDLKKAEGFLRDWQRFVQCNLSDNDKILGDRSRRLRTEELEELRKNNVKISNGDLAGQSLAEVLENDLMDTVEILTDTAA